MNPGSRLVLALGTALVVLGVAMTLRLHPGAPATGQPDRAIPVAGQPRHGPAAGHVFVLDLEGSSEPTPYLDRLRHRGVSLTGYHGGSTPSAAVRSLGVRAAGAGLTTTYAGGSLRPLLHDLVATATTPDLVVLTPAGRTGRPLDAWVRRSVTAVLGSSAYRSDGVLVVLGTSGAHHDSGALVVSPTARGGTSSDRAYDDGSVVATLGDLLGLSRTADAAAARTFAGAARHTS